MTRCICIGGPKDGFAYDLEDTSHRLTFPKFGPTGLESVHYHRRGNKLYYEGLKILDEDKTTPTPEG